MFIGSIILLSFVPLKPVVFAPEVSPPGGDFENEGMSHPETCSLTPNYLAWAGKTKLFM